MFQTQHEYAKYHAAARAISGGPVYVSDKVDEHDFELINMLVNENGEVIRSEETALPAVDCLFRNPTRDNEPYKIFNVNKYSGVVGVFSFANDGKIHTIKVSPSDICGYNGKLFAVYSYKTDKCCLLNKDETINVCVGDRELDIITISEIHDGFAVTGVTEKLNAGGGVKSIEKKDNGYDIELMSYGELLLYSEKNIKEIFVDGKMVEFDCEDGFVRVKCNGYNISVR